MGEKKSAELSWHVGMNNRGILGVQEVPWPTMHHDLFEYVSSKIILEARMKAELKKRRQGNMAGKRAFSASAVGARARALKIGGITCE
jgi:hypothetical protein